MDAPCPSPASDVYGSPSETVFQNWHNQHGATEQVAGRLEPFPVASCLGLHPNQETIIDTTHGGLQIFSMPEVSLAGCAHLNCKLEVNRRRRC
jgi:hypothetical protein